jgi:hypothetical protein
VRELLTDAPASRRQIALLRVDPGLRAAVPLGDRPLAERALIVAVQRLDDFTHSPEARGGEEHSRHLGLIVRGIVVHDVMLAGRVSTTLLGVGDVIARPGRSPSDPVPCRLRWSSGSDAQVAVLGRRFHAASRHWPGLMRVVLGRMADQLDTSATRAVFLSLPRVEDRVLAVLWQLATRWGTPDEAGVTLRLSLTHELIGRLAGARRSTVSLALADLAADGSVRPASRGGLMLMHGSADRLAERVPLTPMQPRELSLGAGARPLAGQRHDRSRPAR